MAYKKTWPIKKNATFIIKKNKFNFSNLLWTEKKYCPSNLKNALLNNLKKPS